VHEDSRVVAVFSGGGSGGHLYPALALADALTELRPDVQPVFVGAERGLEARVLPKRDMEHLLVPVRGLERGRVFANVGVLYDLARSAIRVARLFRRLRPSLVVVTGGYAGAPAGLVARLQGVPLALQDQNALPGVTTLRLARRAAQIHLAFPEAIERLPTELRGKAEVSGNPIRPPTELDRGAARRSFGLGEGATVVLVVGGSQGSRAINQLVLGAVEAVEAGRLQRPPQLEMLWATGPDHFAPVAEALEAVGSPDWVKAVEYIDRMPEALASTNLAVGRAGAMSTSEFMAWGIPSVLIPLPTAAADHQTVNARVLAAAGAAVHLPQSGLMPGDLWTAITGMARDPARLREMQRRARARGRPNAARDIAAALARLLPEASS